MRRLLAALLLIGCGAGAIPDPRAAAREYADAAAKGDADAIYGMLSSTGQKSRSKDDVKRIVTDEKDELLDQSKALASKDARIKASATLRFDDGEQTSLELRDGRFWVTSSDALPGGARSPEEALDQLRRVIARRSYAGLMRILSPATRAAMEEDLRSLVLGLERADTLNVLVSGDTASVSIPGGHRVRLKREGGIWRIDDFDLIPALLAALALALVLHVPQPARAFGDIGAFDPRVLLTGTMTDAAHPSAPGRWAWELVQRTSAPARLHPSLVRADSPDVVGGPFLYWSGSADAGRLNAAEIQNLRRFFALGGVMLVDDATPTSSGPGPFGTSARREIQRVLPDAAPIAIGGEHVIFRSFYLLHRAEGRVDGPKTFDAIVKGGAATVIFSSHDIGGALARGATGSWEEAVVPGGDAQRERAIRLAVNVAMYVLCSNYKDDQVHAPFLMRRRAVAE